MNANDVFQTIFILLIFLALFLVNILSVGIKNIEDNWPVYRCNPIVMPFAGLFGQDVSDNFSYCIQNIQSNYMSYLTLPLNFNLNVISSLGGEITTQINSIRSFISNIRNAIISVIENVFNVFLNMLVQIQVMMASLKDMMGKTIGITLTQLYLITGFTDLMNSAWNGAPGQMVQALQGVCFHSDTLIKTNKGIVKIKDIEINSQLSNNAIVQSKMVISNINKYGNYREDLYIVNGKTNKIKVSGSHLIFDPKEKEFISVKEFSKRYPKYCKKSTKNSDILYCLITSNHTIPIDGWLFHDWEDNNGSVSKTLKT